MKDDLLKNRIWHKIVFTAAVAAVMLFMVTIKVYVRGIKAFNLAEKSYAAQDHEKAMVYYERTLRWYLPFNWRVNTAVQKLWEIGQQAEQHQDRELALKAYRRLRSSLYAIQNVYPSYDSWIDKCNSKLLIFYTANDHKTLEYKQRSAELSAESALPHPAWSLMMEIGFWGWVFSTIGLIWYGFNHQRPIRAQTGLQWAAMILGFYGIWVVSLSIA